MHKRLFQYFYFLMVTLIFLSCNRNNSPIYQSQDFSIFPDRVIQNQYQASVNKEGAMSSNFPFDSDSILRKWNWIISSKNIPEYQSSYPILDAVYRLSYQETENQILGDSIFANQKKATRKLSYATILSLAITHPQICMKSLLQRVENDRIIQDSGAGGSWPINSDRMLWAIAAWEIYKSSGDFDWLRQSFFIIKNSLDDDLNVIWDYKNHLFKGEASFLDWEEQSYPDWMSPADIFESYSFANQAIHYESLQALIQMGLLLDKDVQKYIHISRALKESSNSKFWIEEDQQFGKFLYRDAKIISHNTDHLATSIARIWNFTGSMHSKINTKSITPFGVSYISPLFPNRSVDNRTIKPFVQAFWNWAMAKNRNTDAVVSGLSQSIRSTALLLKNCEEIAMQNGEALHSQSELPSSAAALSNFYRVLLGIRLSNDELQFQPLIPRAYKGRQRLSQFRYRNAILDIEILGFGDRIKSFSFDSILYRKAVVPKDIEGYHKIVIKMNNQESTPEPMPIAEEACSPVTPVLSYQNNQLRWNTIPDASYYKVYQNGELLLKTKDTYMTEISFKEPLEFCVRAVDSLGNHSYLSKPLVLYQSKFQKFLEAEDFTKIRKKKKEFVVLKKSDSQAYYFQVKAPNNGNYSIDFLYANGNGRIADGNACVTRSFWLNNGYLGSIVFPQRGLGNWNDYGHSNSFDVSLKKGYNYFTISFEEFNNNMNGGENAVRIDKINLLRRY